MTAEYRRNRALYENFTNEMKKLVENLVKVAGIRVHSVTCRVKEEESLRNKVKRSPNRYKKLGDVKDICGVRVTTYFADEVDKVAKVVEKEFRAKKTRDPHRQASLFPNTFGYSSLHYLARLNLARKKATENRPFRDLEFEIQICSILQHAWAEIEHDLEYKGIRDPSYIRRFSRLAGLLEFGDEEFMRLRDEMES
jgi:putative GTP pyrophosphokinase